MVFLRGVLRRCMLGVGGAGLLASAVASPQIALMQAQKSSSQAEKTPDLVLYQYQPCPFCNKVRAYFDAARLPYRVVEVNPLFKQELEFSKDYKKVPVCTVNGVQVNGSSEIVSHVDRLVGGRFGPTTAAQQTWMAWADDTLVHLLPANLYRTPRESLQSFDYLLTNGNFGYFQTTLARYSGAAAMYLLCKFKLNKKYNITQPREQLYAAVDQFVAALKGDFLEGKQPGLADVTVFGVLRSLEGYDVFKDVMANSKVAPWYGRMQAVVGPSQRTNPIEGQA